METKLFLDVKDEADEGFIARAAVAFRGEKVFESVVVGSELWGNGCRREQIQGVVSKMDSICRMQLF